MLEENPRLDGEKLLNKEALPKEDETYQSRRFKLDKQFKSGAGWYFLIAGLSIINSIMFMTGKQINFIIGLGATQMVDGFVYAFSERSQVWEIAKYFALAINIMIAGIYALIGFFARKGNKAAFIVGIIFYGLDGLIFLLAGDLLSIGFHIFVLICLFFALKALLELRKLEQRLEMPRAD